MNAMYFGMGFFWLVPILIVGLLAWGLASALKEVPIRKRK
ncbi:hypothetical protein MNBD_GAMMA21-804 [hydrothermal vent metagenome]|uniref:Uncharacterized protein n=1 Tax=hydrothermal vent metagenome TaxID=652676 RepID=A0A3B1AEW5_9ZZZZ